MNRVVALAALAVALGSGPAHASTIAKVNDPVTQCSWSLSGPDIVVRTGPGPDYTIYNGAHADRTCSDPSSDCSAGVTHSPIWVSSYGVGGGGSVSVQPGYCWL